MNYTKHIQRFTECNQRNLQMSTEIPKQNQLVLKAFGAQHCQHKVRHTPGKVTCSFEVVVQFFMHFLPQISIFALYITG